MAGQNDLIPGLHMLSPQDTATYLVCRDWLWVTPEDTGISKFCLEL